MLNILIIDDEIPARERLVRLLESMAGFQVVGEAANGADALEKIHKLVPDILLLDISMPGMDGMELAQNLRKAGLEPAVIFCTAYQDRALEAFDVEAVDYLVKPVRTERLEKALQKAQRLFDTDEHSGDEQLLRSTVGGKVLLTPLSRVVCLLAEDKYTTVVHESGDTVIDKSLTELEKEYPDLFFRVHRNALISKRHLRGLQKISGGGNRVVLSGTDRQPEVSRRNVSALRKYLNQL
jgi:two-component system response regulator AlgR